MNEQIQQILNELTTEEKEVIRDRVKTFMGYKSEIKDLQESMKEQVQAAKAEIKSVQKGDVGKIFAYFRKTKTPQELRNDADAIEDLTQEFGE